MFNSRFLIPSLLQQPKHSAFVSSFQTSHVFMSPGVRQCLKLKWLFMRNLGKRVLRKTCTIVCETYLQIHSDSCVWERQGVGRMAKSRQTKCIRNVRFARQQNQTLQSWLGQHQNIASVLFNSPMSENIYFSHHT